MVVNKVKVVCQKLKRCNFHLEFFSRGHNLSLRYQATKVINYSHVSTGVTQPNETRTLVCFIACFDRCKDLKSKTPTQVCFFIFLDRRLQSKKEMPSHKQKFQNDHASKKVCENVFFRLLMYP